MNNIYLDTETTDFNPGQICELSMIVEDVQTKNYLGCYNYFFEVESVASDAEEVHGFSVEKLKELSKGQKFRDKYPEIYEILKDNCIVAHNVAFDEKFLSSEFWRCGISYRPASKVCTMKTFKDIMKMPRVGRSGYKNPKLSELVSFLGIREAKIADYTVKLFGCSYEDIAYHDSRYDTTSMYIAVNVWRENLARINNLPNTNEWTNMFTNGHIGEI